MGDLGRHTPTLNGLCSTTSNSPDAITDLKDLLGRKYDGRACRSIDVKRALGDFVAKAGEVGLVGNAVIVAIAGDDGVVA